MALGDGTAANGGLSALRIDPSVALGIIVIVAALVLLGIHFSVSASVGRS